MSGEQTPGIVIDDQYVAGIFDAKTALKAGPRKDTHYKLDFTITLQLKVTSKNSLIISVVEKWMNQYDISPIIQPRESTTRLEVTSTEDMKTILEAVEPHLLVQYEQAHIMLNEIIPSIEDGEHRKNKQKFLELVELTERIKELNETWSDRKYDSDYFQDLWADDLSDTA
jgi:hypothetical protein